MAGLAVEPTLTPVELFKVVSDSVVTVSTFDENNRIYKQGSGIAISDGVIASNCHVFKDSSSAVAVHRGQSYQIGLLRSDIARDVCIFSAKGLQARPVSRGSTQTLQIGQRVYAVGAPHGLELTLSDGLLSAFRSVGGLALLQTTAQISPGSSGGGLFDENGKLIGVTTSRIKDSGQLNFAIPVEWIAELESAPKVSGGGDSSRSGAVDKALLEVRQLGEELRLQDPKNFSRRLQLISTQVRSIQSSMPPERWAAEIKRVYLAEVIADTKVRRLHFGDLRTKVSIAAAESQVNQTIGGLVESDPGALVLLNGPVYKRMSKVFTLLPPTIWSQAMTQVYQQVKINPRANEWTFLSGRDGETVAVDAQSVVRTELVKGFFVRLESAGSSPKSTKRAYQVAFLAFDCLSKEVWTSAHAWYDAKDNVLETEYAPSGEPRPVDDSSSWSDVVQLVCEQSESP